MSALTHLATYARTAKHLSPRQIGFRAIKILKYRVLYRCFPGFFRWVYFRGTDRAALSTLALLDEERFGALLLPEREADGLLRLAEDISVGRFSFLNHVEELVPGKLDWTACCRDSLWQYNLNYFDYLVDLGVLFAQTRGSDALAIARGLVDDWIRDNPPGTAISWDPYPTAIRVSNWIRAYYLLRGSPGSPFWDRYLRSLYTQLRFLRRNLEYDLDGNHILEGYLAIVLGGHFFRDGRAKRWRAWGTRRLTRALEEQLLGDGGHFERSPMYHSVILQHLLACLPVLPVDSAAAGAIRGASERMLSFLHGVTCRDGEIPLFGDSAFNNALPPARLMQYGSRITLCCPEDVPTAHGARVQALPRSGIYRLSTPTVELTINGAGITSERQPGHAHCDVFSYELCVGDKRMIVDSGVYTYYGDDQLRQYCRSTSAHNTLSIDGQEQHEIWGRFRVGRRARVLRADLAQKDNGAQFVGVHEGFSFLMGKPRHRRWVRTIGDALFVVVDAVEGTGVHAGRSYVHLNPEVSPGLPGLSYLWGEDGVRLIPLPGTEVGIGEGWYCPEFGRKLRKTVLTFHREDTAPFHLGYIVQAYKKQDEGLLEPPAVVRTCVMEALEEAGLPGLGNDGGV